MLHVVRVFVARVSLSIALLVLATSASAQQREEATIAAATQVLDQIMVAPLRGIPQALLADAEGVAIIPDLIKAGFIVGGRHGQGVLIVKNEQGWQAPAFIKLTGGNIGWQAGVQSTDVILVFKTRQSVQGILEGKLTLGADASAAAGPIGREASAATDSHLKAEIYSYSRSRGLFAGVALDGSVIRVDSAANAAYYPGAGPAQEINVPEPALRLVQQVSAYAGGAAGATVAELPSPPQQQPRRAAPPADGEVAGLRNALAQEAGKLYRLVDRRWSEYLALPQEVFSARGQPSQQALQKSLAKFDAVATDPRYNALSAREEFQVTRELLKQYAASGNSPKSTLELPSPPAAESGPSSSRRNAPTAPQ